jgi:hypothetical protein
MKMLFLKIFFCRGIADATSSCAHRDSSQVSGVATSTDSECYHLDVKVFLAGAELRRET